MMGLLRWSLEALRGGKRLRLYREAARLQWLPREELLRLQLEQVRSLCRLACKTTAYYREVFDSLGLAPEDIRSFEEYGRLPLLTKGLIRERLPDMLSTAIPAEQRFENFSGGSTGSPLRFLQERLIFDTMAANMKLCMTFAGWRPSDMVVNIWGNPRDAAVSTPRVGLKQRLAGSLTLNAYRYGQKDIEDWLRIIRSFPRVLLYGYVSALADVAEHALRTKARLGNVFAVMTSAEKLYGHQREIIQRAFGCKVYDQYGSREVPGIAAECEHGGMHLLTHSAYVEFLPDPELEANRLVVTCLTNRAMPFLRYEIGDYAAPLAETCPCGRGFPLMRMEIGRVVDCLVSPAGQKMYGTFFVRQLYGLDGVSSFQFRQREADHIDLFVVRGPGFDEAGHLRLDEVRRSLEQSLPGVSLTVEYVPEIPRTRGGKHRHVVCEVTL